MPVGGIGTGCFALAGDGALVDWQLMSRPHRGWRPPLAHLLLWVRMPDGKRYLRVLEGMLRPHRFEPGQAAVGSVGDFPADQLHRG
jgi:non-lysosomal glucosylceramidase